MFQNITLSKVVGIHQLRITTITDWVSNRHTRILDIETHECIYKVFLNSNNNLNSISFIKHDGKVDTRRR